MDSEIGKTVSTEECIEWDGATRGKAGHGHVAVNGKWMAVHRLVWAEERGPIPAGMCVLHRCDNPPCINIDHLWLGTQKDNMRDMYAKRRSGQQNRTHCPAGHELSGENLRPSSARKGHRGCRTCVNEFRRKRKAN